MTAVGLTGLVASIVGGVLWTKVGPVATFLYGAGSALVGSLALSLDVTEDGLVVSPRENNRRAKALCELLSSVPAEGKNVVIISHKPNLHDAAGKESGDLAEGETLVFKPLGGGKFKTVARVTPETWDQWAK